jgi:poly-gamma-glutamate synthesis protein (capsule biosynthesis protein)
VRGVAIGLALVVSTAGVVRAEPESTAARASETKPRVTVAAVGDILFARYLRTPKNLRRVSLLDQPFEGVVDVLAGADIAFGNVESPVMEHPKNARVHTSLTFRAEPADAGILADAGFDVVSTANNHTLNLGAAGAAETPEHLEAAGVRAAGAGATEEDAHEPEILEANGVKVAFLCYTVWTNGRKHQGKGGAVAYINDRKVKQEVPPLIKKVREDHAPDFVVVSLHWGFEYEDSARNDQKRAARAMIDAGADLVLGHHAHVLQEVERYKGGVIAYSLGNFLFDNPKLAQRQTIILEATLEGKGDDRTVDVTLHPVIIERSKKQRSNPVLATGKQYRAIAKRLKKLAKGFAIAPDPGKE